MSRKLHRPVLDTTGLVVPIKQGGSHADTLVQGAIELEMLTLDQVDLVDRIPSLDANGQLPDTVIPSGIVFESLHVDGPTIVAANSFNRLYITDYDQYKTYTVSSSAGFATHAEGVIYFKAPAVAGLVTITVNNRTHTLTVDDQYILPPKIITPTQEYLNAGSGFIARSGAFELQQGFPETILAASDATAGDNFGYYVRIDDTGTRALVCAFQDDIGAQVDAGSAYVFFNNNGIWTQEAKLTASDGLTTDHFGYCGSISGDGTRIIIGAPQVDIGGSSQVGAGYVFVRTGTTWTQEQKITLAVRVANDSFGIAVAMNVDGSRLAISAPGRTVGGFTSCGAVYVYARSGTTWNLEAELTTSDKAASDLFGYKGIAFDGTATRLISGAFGKAAATGAAYIFLRTGSAWAQEAKITAPDGATGDQYGQDVAMSFDGSRVVVGSPLAHVNGLSDVGTAYVYTRTETNWAYEAKLNIPDLAASSVNAHNVVISYAGNLIAYGCRPSFLPVFTEGALAIFKLIGTSWSFDRYITASDGDINTNLGTFAGITKGSGDIKIIAGASSKRIGGNTGVGGAYIYDITEHTSTDWQLSDQADFSTLVQSSINDTVNLTSWMIADLELNTDYFLRCRYNGSQHGTSEWSDVQHFKTRSSWLPINEIGTLSAHDKATNDFFGISVAYTADGSRLAVGAYARDVSGVADAGQVYIYTRSGSTYTLETTLSASDRVASDYFGIRVAWTADGSRLAVGAHGRDVAGVSNAGQVYLYTRSGSTYTLETTLSASDRATSDLFGVSVAWTADGSRLAVGAYARDVAGVADAGQVYIYTRSGSTYTLETTLSASDRATSDLFGISVAFTADGSRLAVGAHRRDVAGISDAGQVYIYTRSGSTYTLETTLSPSDRVATDYFGSGVSWTADGSRLAVGAYFKDPGGITEAGQVYLYTRSGSTYTLETTLSASDRAVNDQFGFSVAFTADGSQLAVGAYGRDVAGVVNAGQVYFFQ